MTSIGQPAPRRDRQRSSASPTLQATPQHGNVEIHSRITRNVERADVVAQTRRYGLIKVVECFDVVAQKLEAKMCGCFSQGVPFGCCQIDKGSRVYAVGKTNHSEPRQAWHQ